MVDCFAQTNELGTLRLRIKSKYPEPLSCVVPGPYESWMYWTHNQSSPVAPLSWPQPVQMHQSLSSCRSGTSPPWCKGFSYLWCCGQLRIQRRYERLWRSRRIASTISRQRWMWWWASVSNPSRCTWRQSNSRGDESSCRIWIATAQTELPTLVWGNIWQIKRQRGFTSSSFSFKRLGSRAIFSHAFIYKESSDSQQKAAFWLRLNTLKTYRINLRGHNPYTSSTLFTPRRVTWLLLFAGFPEFLLCLRKFRMMHCLRHLQNCLYRRLTLSMNSLTKLRIQCCYTGWVIHQQQKTPPTLTGWSICVVLLILKQERWSSQRIALVCPSRLQRDRLQ